MKKPFIVSLSLIIMYTFGALLYISINVLIGIFLDIPVSFLVFLFATHFLSILWSFVVLSHKKRRIETRIRWALFICIIPFFGIISYMFFGRVYKYKRNKNYFYSKKIKRTDHDLAILNLNNLRNIEKENPEFKRAFMTAFNQQKEIVYANTKIDYLKDGNEFATNLFNDINKSKKYILLNFYIFKDGILMNQLTKLLIKKMQEGVKVYIIYDFLGCYTQFIKSKRELKNNGAKFVTYAPLHFPFIKWNANYRTHRKDISIDGKIGYIGGINISDEYINKSPVFGTWNDSAIRLKGQAVQQIELIFQKDWDFYKKRKHPKIKNLEKNIGRLNTYKITNEDFIQIISDGPNHQNPMYLETILTLIRSAQKSIWLKSPYFIPPQEIIDALCNASNSGIDVKLIIPGKTDKAFLLDISKNWTRKLYEHGIKIYSVNNTFVHEKASIFDKDISLLGSSNLDFRALFSDQQTFAIIKSKKINNSVRNKMLSDIDVSTEFKKHPKKMTPKWKRPFVKIFNIMSPVL